MVDISSQNNKINVTVSSSGNTANTNVTPDYAQYYSEKSKEWAISNRIVDNTDYSSKYYANESKKQADISTAKTAEVVESGNNAVSNIENARDNAITDITNQENVSVDNVNTAGATQVSSVNTAGITQVANVNSAGTTQINLAKEQVTLATNQANIATEQAILATNKTSEVVASGNEALSNIDNAKTGALTDITNLKNTSVSNITTAKNNAITTITTQETTSKNNVIATGNAQVERVNLTGVDNRTPIFSKNEIGTNEGVYQNVYGLKHSTFDKSKFTVVGNPTITDDGIASGFSTSNYLTKTTTLNLTKPFEIKFKINHKSDNSKQQAFISFNGIGWHNYILDDRTCLAVYCKFADNTAYNLNCAGLTTDEQTYYICFSWNGSTYTLKYSTDNLNWVEKKYNSSVPLMGYDNINTICIGKLLTNNYYPLTTGQIDLKQFSITVDGKEVFSGNKTGLDVIKPDNYTAVGSPVISDDGIASGFSDSNYLSKSINIDVSKKIECVITFTYDNTYGYRGQTFLSWSNTDARFTTYNNKLNISGSPIAGKTTLINGNKYTAKIIYEKGTTELYLLLNDSWSLELTDSYLNLSDNITGIVLGNNHTFGDRFWGGSIDLNAFKIYIDGNLVYQPCLKIPYTQSKTGSKIVDEVYRDRVIDLYEQQGLAGYYTIDEENKNFTLPMGEIYGMIEEAKNKGGSGLELCDIGTALYVDESKGLRRYLNGQIVDINTNTQAFLNRLQEITTLHPSLLCTEEEWQTAKTMSAFGQVGKFVFNYSGENIVSVRLPRIVNVQGLFDLQNLGMTVSAGLPNITSDSPNSGWFLASDGVQQTGAIKLTRVGDWTTSGGPGTLDTYIIRFDASLSNTIYGNSDTVQQEAIQYPYFIQIATGSETENNIINDIELNNPYSLFDSKYSDHELNNLSWLKSEGQWNAKTVYTDAYDKLLKVYNGTETVEGLSVKLSTETYTDYDFVLNTADETFRLPLLNGSEDLISDKFIAQSFTATNSGYIIPITKNGQISIRIYGTSATDVTVGKNGYTVGTFNLQSSTYRQGTITTQVVKGDKIRVFTNVSGTTATCNYLFFENTGNGSLYYYVGETVQNANLIDAGRIGEQLANKIGRQECKAYITETYQNGTSWYRVYSDGWCEQGGKIKSSSATQTVSLLKTYYSNNYNIQILPNTNNGSVNCSVEGIPSTSSFKLKSSDTPDNGFYWQTCGYIA